jgi:hypothetical protein
MTIPELLEALERACPNGVSFAPLATRLWRRDAPAEDWQMEGLKAAMFLMGDVWLSVGMVLDARRLAALKERASAWLEEYGCFSVGRLFDAFRDDLRLVRTVDACAAFLGHLGFRVEAGKKAGPLCVLPPTDLDGALAETAEAMAERLEEAGGALALHQIEDFAPHLSLDALEEVRARMRPEVHRTDIGGAPCWRSSEAVALPDDFSDRLTEIVGAFDAIDKKVTVASLAGALDLSYRVRFREEYGLTDDDAFRRVCGAHYKG